MLGVWISVFFHDNKVRAALLVVTLDLVLGVIASVHQGDFRLSYIADFLKNDILFKLLPYFGLYIAALVAGGVDVVIPGLDMGVVAGAVYALAMAAWVGSILSSLADLGLVKRDTPLKAAVFGPEKTAPVTTSVTVGQIKHDKTV